MLHKLYPSKYKLPCWLRRLDHSWPTFYSLLAKFILSWFQKSTYGQWCSTQRDMYVYTVIVIHDILWAPLREKRASRGRFGIGSICLIRAKKPVQRREGRAPPQKTLTVVSSSSAVQNLHGHGRIVLIETQARLSILGLIGSSWEEWEASPPHLDTALLSVGGELCPRAGTWKLHSNTCLRGSRILSTRETLKSRTGGLLNMTTKFSGFTLSDSEWGVLFFNSNIAGENTVRSGLHRCLGCSLCLVYRARSVSQCFVQLLLGHFRSLTWQKLKYRRSGYVCVTSSRITIICWAPTLCLSSLRLSRFCGWWRAVLNRDQTLQLQSQAPSPGHAAPSVPKPAHPLFRGNCIVILETSQTAFWTVVSITVFHGSQNTRRKVLRCFPELETG